jgi:hypothetical protein
MAKSEEELNEIEAARRHDEILASLKLIAARKNEPVSLAKLEMLLEKYLSAMTLIASKEMPELDLRLLAKEMTSGMKEPVKCKRLDIEIKRPDGSITKATATPQY